MKDFFKYTLATITGIIIFMLVVGIFCVISLIGMAASDSATTVVSDNSVFVLKLSGAVEERASDDLNFMAMLTSGDAETIGLDDILDCIAKAKENEDITHRSIRMPQHRASATHWQTSRRAVNGLWPTATITRRCATGYPASPTRFI